MYDTCTETDFMFDGMYCYSEALRKWIMKHRVFKKALDKPRTACQRVSAN